MQLSVTKDIDGESGIVKLRVNDILFLEAMKKKQCVAFHTLESIFYLPGSLKYWSTTLNNSGYTFRIVDRSNSVNVDKIVRIDNVFKKAYFEYDIRKGSKCCTMSEQRCSDLVDEFFVTIPGLYLS
ncbi:LytTR family transcriptional regulator DNA-binding domain-containing protein [Paenibacillus pini]